MAHNNTPPLSNVAEWKLIMSGDEYDDDFDDVPLQHKKPFGSGLRRNEIKFVPAVAAEGSVTSSTTSKIKGQSVRDFYLGMVLKPPREANAKQQPSTSTVGETTTVELCDICNMPKGNTAPPTTLRGEAAEAEGKRHHHEASIAHQFCLAHSHPPSALVRTRMGLSVLASQGWDPDSRTGLGAAGQGVHYPIKVKPKDNHLGIGVFVPKEFRQGSQDKDKKEKPRNKLLDAKKVRKMAAEDRKRTDKLQQQIFGKIDLEKYLGTGG